MNTISKTDNGIGTSTEDAQGSDLLQLIHDDSKAIAELFFQFTELKKDEEKQEIFAQIKTGLTIHAQLGEDLLFPLVIETAEDEDKEDAEKLVAEAEASNYISSLILDELSVTEPDDKYFEAKMTILCQLTKLQVKREEKEMFDKLRASDIDFEDVAAEAAEMKAELELDARGHKTKSKSKTKAKTKSTTRAKGSTKNSQTGKKANSSKSAGKKTAARKKSR